MKRLKNILFLTILSGISLYAQIDFTADVTGGCETLDVQFNLTTTSGVSSVSWDFGNGQTSSDIVPAVVSYDTVGVYDVTVIINGSETITKNDYIGVFPIPVTAFTINDTIIPGSFNYQFNALSQPVPFDSVHYRYNWDYGDSQIAVTDDTVANHHYSEQGDYTVILRISDSYGCQNTTQQNISVTSVFSVPNIFSPKYKPYVVSTDGETAFKFTVFTRYGTVVYKTEGRLIIWDGLNSNGVLVSPGVYYYIIEEIGGAGTSQTGFVYVWY